MIVDRRLQARRIVGVEQRRVGLEPERAELRMRRDALGDHRRLVRDAPEPQRRQDVQRRVVRPAVVDRDAHQDVVRRALRVLDLHVEVAVLVEHARVQQLELRVSAPASVVHQRVVRIRPLRVLVEALHVGVRGRGVQVEPVLLDVLAVVALAVGQPEEALLEDRVLAVPQRQRQAQPLLIVGDARDPVLAPAVRARARLVVREGIPRVAVCRVVLAHRAPLALGQIRTPRLPRRGARPRRLQPVVLGGLHTAAFRRTASPDGAVLRVYGRASSM